MPKIDKINTYKLQNQVHLQHDKIVLKEQQEKK